MRMRATISACNNWLRFPQVIGGNLHAPTDKLRESFIVCIGADFLKPKDFSFYPVSNTLTEVPFPAFEVNGTPLKFDSVPK